MASCVPGHACQHVPHMGGGFSTAAEAPQPAAPSCRVAGVHADRRNDAGHARCHHRSHPPPPSLPGAGAGAACQTCAGSRGSRTSRCAPTARPPHTLPCSAPCRPACARGGAPARRSPGARAGAASCAPAATRGCRDFKVQVRLHHVRAGVSSRACAVSLSLKAHIIWLVHMRTLLCAIVRDCAAVANEGSCQCAPAWHPERASQQSAPLTASLRDR